MSEIEAIGNENKRRIMGSSIFGDEPQQVQPIVKTPPRQPQPQQIYDYQPPQYSNQSYGSINQFNGVQIPQIPRFQPSSIPTSGIKLPQIEAVQPPPPLPALSPFPDFNFSGIRIPDHFDLGVKPRTAPHEYTPTKLPMNSIDEMRKIRETLQRDTMVFNEKMKRLSVDEPIRVQQFQYQPPKQIQPMEKDQNPTFTTTTEYILPDGTSFK